MSSDDGVYQSASNRRRRLHRTRIAVGVTGLAVLLGAGSYLVTAEVLDRRSVTGEVGALAPVVTPAPAPWTPMPAPRTPRPTLSTKNAVRQALSPIPPPSAPPSVPPSALAVTPGPVIAAETAIQDKSQTTPTGTLRIISADFDLTGQRVLAWAADRGKAVSRSVRCTQNLKFAGDPAPSIRPTVLLCWRTSATRSVATFLTDSAGHPSVARSVQVIDREWTLPRAGRAGPGQ